MDPLTWPASRRIVLGVFLDDETALPLERISHYASHGGVTGEEAVEALLDLLADGWLMLQSAEGNPIPMSPPDLPKKPEKPAVYTTMSKALGERIMVARDGVPVPETDLVAYRESEIAAMKGLTREDLLAVHEMKKAFGGTYAGEGQGPQPGAYIPIRAYRPTRRRR